MPLIDPMAPDDAYGFLDEASSYFLRAIKQHYTRDTAVEVMDALTPILGKDWKGRVIFGIMANHYPGIKSIRLRRDFDVQQKKINAIKEVRYISGMGLVDAKNAVETSDQRPVDVPVQETNASMDQKDWNNAVKRSIDMIRSCGYKVEFA